MPNQSPKHTLEKDLINAVDKFRIDSHKSFEQGLDVAIEHLQGLKTDKTPLNLAKPLRTPSEHLEGIKKRHAKKWTWLPTFGKGVK